MTEEWREEFLPFMQVLDWEGWRVLKCTQQPKIVCSDNSGCAAGLSWQLERAEWSKSQINTYISLCINVNLRLFFFCGDYSISVIMLVSFLKTIPNPKNHASGIYFSSSPVQNVGICGQKPSGSRYRYSGFTYISLQYSYGLISYVLQMRSIIIVIKWDFNFRHFYRYYNRITDNEERWFTIQQASIVCCQMLKAGHH